MRIGETRSVSFAKEMVRAALPLIPSDLRLNGPWMEVNMDIGDVGASREVTLLVAIHGVPCRVLVEGTVFKELGGLWKRGVCAVCLIDNPDTKWHFVCRLEGNRITANHLTSEDFAEMRY